MIKTNKNFSYTFSYRTITRTYAQWQNSLNKCTLYVIVKLTSIRVIRAPESIKDVLFNIYGIKITVVTNSYTRYFDRGQPYWLT